MLVSVELHSDPTTRLIGLLFSAIGGCVLLVALAIGLSHLSFINEASSALGTVVSLNAGGSHPEIRFTTSSGEVVECPQGGFIFGYQVGDRVTVLYDGQSPHEACVDATGALWGVPIFLLVIGGVFTVVGVSKALGDNFTFG